MGLICDILYSMRLPSFYAYYKLTANRLIKVHKYWLVRYINIPLEQ